MFTGISISSPDSSFFSLLALLAALLAAAAAYFLVRYLVGNSGRLAAAIKQNPIPIIVAACVLVLVYYAVDGTLADASVHVEVVSVVVQFLFLIVLGGAVTALYQARLQHQASEERRTSERANITDRDRQILLAMHDDLVSAYNKAKRARRLMRARLEYPRGDASTPAYVPKSVYDDQMEALIDAELDFESILRRIDSNVPLFGRDSKLDGSLDVIEGHLTQTVKEYRRDLRNFEGDPPQKRLDELPRLEAFLGLAPLAKDATEGQDDGSRRRFKDHFNEAIQYLRIEIGKRARRINRTGSILWVDDNPKNNGYEIDQLAEDGYEVTTVRSTRQAEKKLAGGLKPMLIISDMGRVEGDVFNPQAGLDLLKKIRDIPVYHYVSYEAVRKYGDAVMEAGGKGITDSRLQLFRFIDDCADAVEAGDEPIVEAAV